MPSKLLTLNQQSKVWLILIALWIINGSSFLAIKVAIDTIPPLLSAGLRFSISGAILFTVYFLQTKRTEHRSDRYNPQQDQKDPQYEHEHKGVLLARPLTQEHITTAMETQLGSWINIIRGRSRTAYLGRTISFFWNNRVTQFYYSTMGCNNWLFIIQK